MRLVGRVADHLDKNLLRCLPGIEHQNAVRDSRSVVAIRGGGRSGTGGVGNLNRIPLHRGERDDEHHLGRAAVPFLHRRVGNGDNRVACVTRTDRLEGLVVGDIENVGLALERTGGGISVTVG